jgi:hypothetical protein
LLTEEDLNRLDYYIQAKNRLHNRHLHGWGVVCGLEVVCGVCEPDQRHVIVKPGYALSPCGNDIVVCRQERVDICDLIERCRPPADECYDLVAPPTQPPQSLLPNDRIADCGGGTQDWILAICYAEKPSRGVAALRANVCDCGCGCGQGGGCTCGSHAGNGHHGAHGHGAGSGSGSGCGCGCKDGTRKGKPPRHKTPRTVPEQCEPTVTCEGYRFVVYKAPAKTADRRREFGAATRRFLCCLEPLFRELEALPPSMTLAQAQQWLVAFRDAVRDFIINEGLYDCEIASKLAAIVIPQVSNQPPSTALLALNEVALALFAVAVLALQKCFCAALLPPCPPPEMSDCVPLATVTVARDHCRVLRICNLSHRKFLITIPNILYWLSFLNLFAGSTQTTGTTLRDLLERFCCRPLGRFDDRVNGTVFFRTATQPEGVSTGASDTDTDLADSMFASLLWDAVANPDRPVGIEHVLLGVLGARDAEGKAFVTDNELEHPSEFLLLNQVVAPLVRTLLPAERVVEAAMRGAAASSDHADRVDDLARELADLRATVQKQERTIAKLKKRS